MAQAVVEVSNASIATPDENPNSDDEGLSTDEEDDLNVLIINLVAKEGKYSDGFYKHMLSCQMTRDLIYLDVGLRAFIIWKASLPVKRRTKKFYNKIEKKN